MLEDLQIALEPLPEAPAPSAPAAPGEPQETTTERPPILQLRQFLRELDRALADEPARVLDHPSLVTAGSRSPQVLARQAAAWLAVSADDLESNVRRTLELARFCAVFHFLDHAERELFLPEAWPLERLLALRGRAMAVLGEEGD